MTDAAGSPVIPRRLRFWFVVHFAADVLFAVPLFIFPVQFLTRLGWSTVDPITARMVAAALFGIGIESLLSRNAGGESYKTMLTLKIIWSSAAIIGLTIALVNNLFGIQLVGLGILLVFVLFNLLWVYWRWRIRR